MKNKYGFTLIELLAVIVVLGLMALLVYPAIEKTLLNSRNDLYEMQINNIIDGAKNWIADHPHDIPKNDGDILTISLCDLKIGAYIDTKITNPNTEKLFDCATKIKIKNINNIYEYSVDFENTVEENIIDNLKYPNIKLVNNYLEYINVNDYYCDYGIKINGNIVKDDTYDYEVNITTDIIDENGSPKLYGYAAKAGNYTVKYEIIEKITGLKTVLYRTIIVK